MGSDAFAVDVHAFSFPVAVGLSEGVVGAGKEVFFVTITVQFVEPESVFGASFTYVIQVSGIMWDFGKIGGKFSKNDTNFSKNRAKS